LTSVEALYDVVKLDPSNSTAQIELVSSFYRAETAAVQALFNSLNISVPETESVTKLSTNTFAKADLEAKYEDRFALVFNYVFTSVRVLKLLLSSSN
jgi:hypothetical protein